MHESHIRKHAQARRSHKLEALTEPVFAGDLPESLAVGLPSSEEVDGAVLPALDHLHMAKTARQRGGQGSDENHLAQRVSSSSCDESPQVPLVAAELI